jgi:hypothetical protein
VLLIFVSVFESMVLAQSVVVLAQSPLAIIGPPIFVLSATVWLLFAAVIGYGYRHFIPLGYALVYSYIGVMMILFRVDDFSSGFGSAFTVIAFLLFTIGPFIGFWALHRWYAQDAPSFVDRLFHPEEVREQIEEAARSQPEVQVVVSEDSSVYIDGDEYSIVDDISAKEARDSDAVKQVIDEGDG